MGLFNLFGFGKKKTLFYLDPFAAVTEKKEYQEIFDRLGVSFVDVEGTPFYCGYDLYQGGYTNEAKKLAKKNYRILQKAGIKRIVTSSPAGYLMLRDIYPKLIVGWDIEVLYILALLLEEVQKKGYGWGGELTEQVVYHDSCVVGRGIGLYEEPRNLLATLGIDVIEMKRNKKSALCSGGCGGMLYTDSVLAKRLAQQRIQDLPLGAQTLVTPCSVCARTLKLVYPGVVDFSTLVLTGLRRSMR